MYTGKVYGIWDMAKGTRFETPLFLLLITFWVAAYYYLDLHWLRIPWSALEERGRIRSKEPRITFLSLPSRGESK